TAAASAARSWIVCAPCGEGIIRLEARRLSASRRTWPCRPAPWSTMTPRAILPSYDTAGKLARWGCGGRGPPRRFFFAPGSGGFAARTRRKTKSFLEGKALQTSHLSKPAVSPYVCDGKALVLYGRCANASHISPPSMEDDLLLHPRDHTRDCAHASLFSRAHRGRIVCVD